MLNYVFRPSSLKSTGWHWPSLLPCKVYQLFSDMEVGWSTNAYPKLVEHNMYLKKGKHYKTQVNTGQNSSQPQKVHQGISRRAFLRYENPSAESSDPRGPGWSMMVNAQLEGLKAPLYPLWCRVSGCWSWYLTIERLLIRKWLVILGF